MIRNSNVRRLAHRAVTDWKKVQRFFELQGSGAEVKKVAEMRAEYAAIETSINEYASAPAPIDWTFYGKAINNAAYVAQLKQNFEGSMAKVTDDAVKGVVDSDEAITSGRISEYLEEIGAGKDYASIAASLDKEMVALKERLDFQTSSPITEDTTVAELLKKFPDPDAVEEEIEQEIADHHWKKDTE